MSIDDLKADLTRNVEQLDALQLLTSDDVKKYLSSTLWPFLSNVVEEINDLDGDVTDLVEQAEDILQPETAGIFATVITQCMGLAAELEKRLKPSDVGDKKWAQRLKTVRAVCNTAKDTLLQITVTPEDDDEVDPEESEEPVDDTQPSPTPANEETPDAG